MASLPVRRWGRPTIALIAVAAVVLAGLAWVGLRELGSSPTTTLPGGVPPIVDRTSALGASFHPGAIQGFGTNASTIFYAGISVWDRPAGYTLPEADRQVGSGPIENYTPALEPYFHQGGVFGTVWNGSTWLISGEATWGSASGGALIRSEGAGWVNLTPQFRPYFFGQGIWAVGWNGSSWLLAGNSSDGAAMVAYRSGVITDLTPRLPHNARGDWIQLLVWNGSSWIVGGKGIFGAWDGHRYVDLLPGSPFADSGVFAADWNGTTWVVGGGPPAAIVLLRGTTLGPAVPLAPAFTAWVNSVVWTPSGWLLGGKGFTHAGGGSTPQLALWSGASGAAPIDLSQYLPTPFAGGQVQFAAWAPPLGPRVLLLVGQGALDDASGYSVGALAEIDWPA